jgi:hypothetical protein
VNVYLTGAGASASAGYPLGDKLLTSIGEYVSEPGDPGGLCPDKATWNEVCKWLKTNPDAVIREAYRNGNWEYLFTTLDLAYWLFADTIARQTGPSGIYSRSFSATRVPPEIAYRREIQPYLKAHDVLLQGLWAYLRKKHHDDRVACDNENWKYLYQFADVELKRGDNVITLNYDSTLERVLLAREKWHPGRGYGFKVEFVRSRSDTTALDSKESPVIVLHLHGAVGWSQKAFTFKDQTEPGLITKCLEEPIWLDSEFLEDLGFDAVDTWAQAPSPYTDHLLLYPSFLKSPGGEPGSHALTGLWKAAAKALRDAEMVFIIGYSLPAADTATAALLVGNCDRQKVEVVDPSKATHARLRGLLRLERRAAPETFKNWLRRRAQVR